jgi:sortase A
MRVLALADRAQYAFWFAGTLLCGLYAGAVVESHIYQSVENRRLDQALLSGGAHASSVRPRGSSPRAVGSLVGRLEIPRLKLKAIVLEGTESSTLRRGIGRLPETADPGQEGNVVLSGHRDTFFRPLHGIAAGDHIRLVTPGGAWRYLVEWTAIVDPADTAVIGTTPEKSLTLVTCYPFRYVGLAPQRFIVRARQEMPTVTKPVSY